MNKSSRLHIRQKAYDKQQLSDIRLLLYVLSQPFDGGIIFLILAHSVYKMRII